MSISLVFLFFFITLPDIHAFLSVSESKEFVLVTAATSKPKTVPGP